MKDNISIAAALFDDLPKLHNLSLARDCRCKLSRVSILAVDVSATK